MVLCKPRQTCKHELFFLWKISHGSSIEFQPLLNKVSWLCLVSSRAYLRHGISIWVDVPLDYLANEMLMGEVSSPITVNAPESDSFSEVSLSLWTTKWTFLDMFFVVCFNKFLSHINLMKISKLLLSSVYFNFYYYVCVTISGCIQQVLESLMQQYNELKEGFGTADTTVSLQSKHIVV